MGAGTSTITSSLDRRHIKVNEPIWEKVLTFTFASGTASITTQAVPINGLLQKIVVTNSNVSGAVVTYTVAILDNADNTIFSVASLAESTTYNYSVNEPVAGTIDIAVTPSTDPLSAGTVTVTLRGV